MFVLKFGRGEGLVYANKRDKSLLHKVYNHLDEI